MAGVVVLTGICVGGFFGALADSRLLAGMSASDRSKWLFHGRWVFTGLAFGMTAGMLAGVVWSKQFFQIVKTSLRPNRLMRRGGTRWGAIVGTFAGVTVYIWLQSYLVVQRRELDLTPYIIVWLVISSLVGGLVGMITGYLCSWLGYGAARMALPLPPVNPKTYRQRPI